MPLLVSLERTKRRLGISELDTTKDDVVSDAIEDAVGLVEALINHPLSSQTLSLRVDGSGEETLYLPLSPITEITRIAFDTRTSASEGMRLSELRSWDQFILTQRVPELSELSFDRAGGVVRLDGGLWPRGTRNIEVDFTGGYTEDSLPHDLRRLVLDIIAFGWVRRGREGLSSVSINNFSADFVMPSESDVLGISGAKDVIARYRRSF